MRHVVMTTLRAFPRFMQYQFRYISPRFVHLARDPPTKAPNTYPVLVTASVLQIYSQVRDSDVYRQVALGLRDKKLETLHVFLSLDSTPLRLKLQQEGLETLYLTKSGLYHLAQIRSLRKIIKESRPSLIVAYGQTANTIAGLLTVADSSVRFLSTRGHADYYRSHWKIRGPLYDAIATKICDRLLVPSTTIRDYLVERRSCSGSKIFIAPYQIDSFMYQTCDSERIERALDQIGCDENSFIVLTASRPTPVKGLEYVVQGFAGFYEENPNAHLVMTNWRGEPYPQLQAALRQVDSDHVHLIPSAEDFPATLAAADVFVHVPTSRFAEGFGQVYLEALASGTPCIFTTSGVLPDLPSLKGSYIRVGYESPDEIAAGLEHVRCNRADAELMAVRAQTIMTGQSPAAMVEDFMHVYEDLLGS